MGLILFLWADLLVSLTYQDLFGLIAKGYWPPPSECLNFSRLRRPTCLVVWWALFMICEMHNPYCCISLGHPNMFSWWPTSKYPLCRFVDIPATPNPDLLIQGVCQLHHVSFHFNRLHVAFNRHCALPCLFTAQYTSMNTPNQCHESPTQTHKAASLDIFSPLLFKPNRHLAIVTFFSQFHDAQLSRLISVIPSLPNCTQTHMALHTIGTKTHRITRQLWRMLHSCGIPNPKHQCSVYSSIVWDLTTRSTKADTVDR